MFEELNVRADKAAQRLLGCELEHKIGNEILRVRIVETEAYDQDDPGSHAFTGVTPRNEIMFGPAGFLYVYFIYGMYHCCNIVTGRDGHGEAVLIRAVEPIIGEEFMEARRGKTGVNLTNGPGKLCNALGIDKRFNAHDLSKYPLQLIMKDAIPKKDVVTTTRIGLKKGADTQWRFYIKDNPYVSKK